jgi:hypothetical protein
MLGSNSPAFFYHRDSKKKERSGKTANHFRYCSFSAWAQAEAYATKN